jgi:hypothetical protein
MIKFNTILESESIDPAQIKLVRHKADGLYQLWLHNKDGFERWQKFQAEPEFSGATIIASFVVTPFGETIFVGLYSVNGAGDVPDGFIDPLTGKEVGQYNTVTGKLLAGKHILYDLSPMQKLKDHEGKLVIDWGKGYLAWTQWAKNQNKDVLEIRRVISEPAFPGYLKFRTRLSELANVPASWRIALSSVSGIYLLVNPESGKQYVGIALGAGGFWGRWESYVASGHGGNKRMQDIPAADYQVTILEVASMPIENDALVEMEGRWKEKLLSRKFGLNAN